MAQSTSGLFTVEKLPGATFGAVVRFGGKGARAAIAALEREPSALPDALYAANGFLFLPEMQEIVEEPQLLVRLSKMFGPEVENNLTTYTAENKTLFNIHEQVPEIIIVTNLPPISRQPMARPNPPLTADGKFPTQIGRAHV